MSTQEPGKTSTINEDVREEMRQKAQGLYGKNAHNSAPIELVRRGAGILEENLGHGIPYESFVEMAEKEGKKEAKAIFSASDKPALDAALRHLDINFHSNDGARKYRKAEVESFSIDSYLPAYITLGYEFKDNLKHDMPSMVQWKFNRPMAEALDEFLGERRGLVEEMELAGRPR